MKHLFFLFIGRLAKTTSAQKNITDIFPDLNNVHKWDASNGDTWDPFLADNDTLYSFNFDGGGFGSAGKSSNLPFIRLMAVMFQNL